MKNFLLLILLFTSIFSLLSQNNQKPKIGLTLSGGGAKGLAHIGVLKVLEEAGIRPDYITGTSMGSIIGGLYAIGYSPEELEKFVEETDWDKLINDYISRKDLAMTEKEYFEKYILDIQIKKEKNKAIKILAPAMHSGFNIMMRLIELTERVEDINNFYEFEIPFKAIAADVEHGESLVLNKGSLAMAMRASMAIPSVFSPVMINDTLLVDGGLLNNYPVKEVKDMGAEIVIGVDVQSPFYKQEDLYSVLNIIQQTSKILRKENNEKSRKLTDYYIKPEVTQFNVLGFENADTIIKLGEIAARKMLPELKKLAEKYGYNYKRDTTKKNYPVEKIYKISDIKIKGLKNVTRKLVLGRLAIDTTGFVSQKDVENAIIRLRGSEYFTSIFYEIKHKNYNTILSIDVQEKTSRQFKVGVNFNTISKASVLLTYVSKNLLAKGSRLQLSAKIGQNPMFFGDFFIDNGWKPGFGISVLGFTKDIALYDYKQNNPSSTFNLSNLITRIYTQSSLYNSVLIGIGAEYEGTLINKNVSVIDFDEYQRSYFNIVGYLKIDLLDKLYFSNTGFLINTTFKTIFESYYDPRIYLSLRYMQSIPIIKNRFNILPKIYTGTNIGEDIPIEYLFTTNEFFEFPIKSFMPFIGLKYNQRYAKTVVIGRLDLRYMIFKNNYITLSGNLGSFAKTYEYILKNDNKDYMTFGVGITYSMETIIGPISLSFAESDYTHTVFTYFSLGFQF